jgi:hypothetical protein
MKTREKIDIPGAVLAQWPRMTIKEKFPYIVDPVEISQLLSEFLQLGAIEDIDCLSLEEVSATFDEFRSPKEIQLFWKNCDEDENGLLCFSEYSLCRGDFDKMGNQYQMSEYELRDKLIISEYSDLLMVERKEYKYDENGIIIDT